MKTTLLFLSVFLSVSLFGQDATKIYNQTILSLVTIETNKGYGSGFFVAPNTIATNYHVVEGAVYANCYVSGSSSKFKIEGYLGIDKSVDLVLLKVSELNRPKLEFADNNISPGQKVFVFGTPKGLPSTISDGIVSGMRDFSGRKLIQMTAPISPGSSGGPVLNSSGKLIGITVSQFSEGQNLNFAIPKNNLELLLQFKKDIVYPFKTTTSSQIQNNPKQSREEIKKSNRRVAAVIVGAVTLGGLLGVLLGNALY